MPNVKELKDDELEKVAGGAIDISKAKYKIGDIFFKTGYGSETYVKITGFWDSSTEIAYIVRYAIFTYISELTTKATGTFTESELDSNYTKVASYPSYINFD